MDLAVEKLPKDSALDFAIGTSKLRAKKQATVLDNLEGLLPSRNEYWDLAAASRRVKSCMTAKPCNLQKASEPQWENDHNACLHNQLLGTLDILQRNAYFEIRDKVWDAVEGRLPAELIAKVFDQVLEAEEIPLDPRIIVSLKGSAGGQYRSNRFLCEHDRKAAQETPPEVGIAACGLDFEYVRVGHPPGMEECMPEFPISVDSAYELFSMEERAQHLSWHQ